VRFLFTKIISYDKEVNVYKKTELVKY
jgi:hypothetical protein